VPRTNCSLVVFGQHFSQITGLAWRQITVANWGYDQTPNHIVGINYRLLNGRRIRSVGYVQFCGNYLVRQDDEAVALSRTIQDLKQLRLTVADRAQRQTLQWPNVGMIFPVALRIRTILPWIAGLCRAGNGITPRACVTRLRFIRAATEYISRVTQKWVARAITPHAKGVEQSIIADDDLHRLIWRQTVRKTGLANRSWVIRPLIPISDKIGDSHPLNDKSIRDSGLFSDDIDGYV